MQHSRDVATNEMDLSMKDDVNNTSGSFVSPSFSDGARLEVEDVIDEDVRNVLNHVQRIDD